MQDSFDNNKEEQPNSEDGIEENTERESAQDVMLDCWKMKNYENEMEDGEISNKNKMDGEDMKKI